MSRMQKVILCSGKPVKKLTEEEMKEEEKLLDILGTYGVVRITDPLKTDVNIIERVKKDPSIIQEYNGELSIEDFHKRLVNGEYDRK